jgi:hypothetical protein
LGTRTGGTLRRQTANQNTRCQHAHPKTERNLPIHSGGIVPSFGVLLRYQVAPQVPVLVFRLTARYLRIHRTTVAILINYACTIGIRSRIIEKILLSPHASDGTPASKHSRTYPRPTG